MKLHQMRLLCEAAARNFNFSEVARGIHASQSVVSRQMQQLEAELGFDVLVRRGKRIVGLSPEGETVLAIARRLMKESDELKRFAEGRARRGRPNVTIATTHFHARYTLLDPILRFRERHPEVLLKLMQNDPRGIERLVETDEADLGISVHVPGAGSEVVSVPYQSVPRVVITPAGHALLRRKPLTLERIAACPLIVYDEAFSGGWSVMRTFRDAGLRPNVVLTAMDADVMKAYVAAGLGVAVVQSAVYDARADRGLRSIDASHLFAPLEIAVKLKARRYLSQALIDFVAIVIPDLDLSKLGIGSRVR
jgi:LysR family cys regulon transcriptional activator